jgi:hypothetical protein
MSSHDLVDATAGLASRADNLVAQHTGEDCRELERQQERLEKLTLAVITAALDESSQSYRDALGALNTANNTIGEGDRKIEQISRVITLVAKAADLVEAVLKKTGGLP